MSHSFLSTSPLNSQSGRPPAGRPGRVRSSTTTGRSLRQSPIPFLLLLFSIVVGHTEARGQVSPPFRFGGIIAANANILSLDVAGVDSYDVFGPRDWNDNAGAGLSPYIGGFFSYVPGTFGLQARAVYNGLGGTFVNSDPVDIKTGIAYFSLAPALRISQKRTGLHFLIGPSFDFEVNNSIQFPDPTDATSPSSFPVTDLKANMISLFGGVGYDFVLSSRRTDNRKTSWLLTPFLEIQHAPEQSGNAERDWSTTSVRFGIQVAYAYDQETDRKRENVAAAPPPSSPASPAGIDLQVETPGQTLAGDRNVDEFFPLLNYLFFPPSSASLPDSYRLLSPRDAASFNERLLMNESPSAGAPAQPNRAARQLRVYDNVLNVVGARMRDNPGSSVSLVGADPDPDIATDRAEMIKSYLVSTFAIDPERITTRGVARPPHASGTRSTPRGDLGFIAEENRRVEILSNDRELLRPVRINTTEEDPLENDLLFRLNLKSSASVSQWDLLVENVEGDFRQAYGPFYSGIARINSTPLAATGADRFRATATGVTFEGDTIRSTREFAINAGSGTPGSTTRFSILFEYDDSKSVGTYEDFLVNEVAPRVPSGSTVYVFGHTDLTGTESYNRDLSARRSAETEDILSRELVRLGREVRFDTYGFGETPFRAPFGNASPEERYYNRTVIIEIVPPAP